MIFLCSLSAQLEKLFVHCKINQNHKARMATTKNATLRYHTLDKCFRNPGRIYFWQDLLEECNKALVEFNGEGTSIQRRQLLEDISFMKSEQGWSIPLKRYRYGRKVYYRYADTSFSINNQPLNETEANQIKSALMIMSRFTGTPQFEWVNEIIPLLQNKLGIIKQEKPTISFDTNIDLKGIDFLSPLFSAIVNQQVLKVVYKSFTEKDEFLFVFHPYYLKQYNTRWFVLGLNQKEENPYWNLALDRIVSIESCSEKYVYTDIDWDDYFFDIVGVTRYADENPQEVVLEFAHEQAPYIITKPIHPTQKHQLMDNGLVVRISVIPNYELEKLIMSFGEKVKVVAPDVLRNKIEERLKNAIQLYQK